MKRADVLRAIDEEMLDIFKTELRNVFGSVDTESLAVESSQLATGFDRVIKFEALAIQIANQKFKE